MRKIFNSLAELREYVRDNPNRLKQVPYKITDKRDGAERFAMSSNSDQAIAAVARGIGMVVESIPINDLINNQN